MSAFHDQLAKDRAVFFNTAEFAAPILYNDVEITAILHKGETNTRGEYLARGTQDNAFFWVTNEAVPDPKPNDEIIHKGKTYRVERIVVENSLMIKLQVTANKSVHPSRGGKT